jgi:nitrogen fixation protein NifU and related proteins
VDTKDLYREILNEHNLNPSHKKQMDNPSLVLNGVNPSCGDNITLNLKVDGNNKITDGSFTGNGCAVSQASVDMMLDLIIGKDKDEALRLAGIFMNMIQGKAKPEEIEELDEAASLEDIARMPARVKCAVLGWRTMKEMLNEEKETKTGTALHCSTK